MTHPRMFDDDDPVLARVRAVCLALPDAAEKVSHGRPTFFTTKTFATYGGSVKLGGGRHERHEQSLLLKPSDDDELRGLLADPRCFYPAYVGPSGWYGIDLDEETDWPEIAELVEESYRVTAGPRRVARLDSERTDGPPAPG
ncbi:MmcQ/YjbR family DNA-binding protein [Georgenia sp. Z1344]|uniref:MmcQ/YjbR family DNA-binding protein n=1 Tax=Georgenia sp. Z1344 TaxID=3416706 RepID=UPI003CFA4565